MHDRLLISDDLLGCSFGFAFFLEPVAVTADVDYGGTMQEPVESGRGHDGIAGKDLVPIGEGFVAGENDGLLLLVAFTDGLKQETG